MVFPYFLIDPATLPSIRMICTDNQSRTVTRGLYFMFKITWTCGISKFRFERVGDRSCFYLTLQISVIYLKKRTVNIFIASMQKAKQI